MVDLDDIILNDLRTGGPWTLDSLVHDLNERDRLGLLEGVGLIGGSAALESLNRLKAAGRAVEGPQGWEFRPPRPEKVFAKKGQRSFLDEEQPCTLAGLMASKAGLE